MRVWTTLKSFLGFLTAVQYSYEETCGQKETPPGTLVVPPGRDLTLGCAGWVTIDGMNITISWMDGEARRGTETSHTQSKIAQGGDPNNRPSEGANLVEEQPRGTGRGPASPPTGETPQPNKLMEQGPELHSQEEDEEDEDDYDAEDERVGGREVRGLRGRAYWTLNGQKVRGRGAKGGGRATLKLPSLQPNDSGNYSCSRGGNLSFSVGIVVGASPEQPTLSCYRKSFTSKIRCDWTASQPVVPPPKCKLFYKKGLTDSFSVLPCSYSVARARCWCVLGQGDEGSYDRYVAYLCVTNSAGTATSRYLDFLPSHIIKPDPPANVTACGEEGRQHRLRVSWSYPSSWKKDYYLLDFQLSFQPLPNGKEIEVKTTRVSYTITDALPGVEYLIKVRAKEEFEGQWSEWSPPVKACTWTAPRSTAGSNTYPTLDPWPFSPEGSGMIDGNAAVDKSQSQEGFMWSHVCWGFGACGLLLLTLLSIYVSSITRHRPQVLSKLWKLGSSSLPKATSEPPPSAPLPSPQRPREEGRPLVIVDPARDAEPPSLQEEGNGTVHFNNMGYFMVSRD